MLGGGTMEAATEKILSGLGFKSSDMSRLTDACWHQVFKQLKPKKLNNLKAFTFLQFVSFRVKRSDSEILYLHVLDVNKSHYLIKNS